MFLFNDLYKQAIKIGRYVSLFGIIPTVILILFISLERTDSFGTHGVAAFVMSTYGIIVPLSIIVKSKKIKSFAKQYIRDLCQRNV
jgi:hypothetical protein